MSFQEFIRILKADGYSEQDIEVALDIYLDILGGIK